MERGFKSWAEKEAVAIRKRLGLAPRDRLPARALLTCLGAMVTRPALVPGMTTTDITQLTEADAASWSALTLVYNDTPIVILNDSHTQQRQESDLHHEAAHLLRGHQPCKLVPVGELTLRVFDQRAEDEAGWLAGCLHLPRSALLTALRNGHQEDAIASRYVASAEMVRYRRSVTGVDRQLNGWNGRRRP